MTRRGWTIEERLPGLPLTEQLKSVGDELKLRAFACRRAIAGAACAAAAPATAVTARSDERGRDSSAVSKDVAMGEQAAPVHASPT